MLETDTRFSRSSARALLVFSFVSNSLEVTRAFDAKGEEIPPQLEPTAVRAATETTKRPFKELHATVTRAIEQARMRCCESKSIVVCDPGDAGGVLMSRIRSPVQYAALDDI